MPLDKVAPVLAQVPPVSHKTLPDGDIEGGVAMLGSAVQAVYPVPAFMSPVQAAVFAVVPVYVSAEVNLIETIVAGIGPIT